MLTRWQDIFNHLKNEGFDVYPPATHKGECISKYIVLKSTSKNRINNLSSVSQQYDLLLYVPKNEYSKLEEFVNGVESSMKKLEPMIKPLYSQTSPYYDDSIKGHMVSIQYKNSRKI